MTSLNLTCLIQKNPEVMHMLVDGELIILGPNDQIPYQINKVGALIWSLLEDRPLSSEHIANYLQQRFQLSIEKATQSTLTFMTTMLEKNIFTQIQTEAVLE